MACNDWPTGEGAQQRNALTIENMRLTNQVGVLRAMLCGALTVLDSLNARDLIDYDEAGVTKQQFDEWWSNHKNEDELAAARKAVLDKAAMLLTPEELELLRLK